MNKYPNFWHVLIGDGPIGTLLGLLVIAFLAALVRVFIKASERDIAHEETPVLWRWKFFFTANIYRLLANFCAIPLLVRIAFQLINDPLLQLLSAIGIGIGADYAASLLQKIGLLSNKKFSDKVMDQVTPKDPVITPRE